MLKCIACNASVDLGLSIFHGRNSPVFTDKNEESPTMRALVLLQPFLLAVTKKPTHWFIDGDNLLAHKGTAGDRHDLTQKLLEIQGSAAEEIVLVFDGRKGEETSITQEGMIRLVELGEGLQSDDFIQDEIQKFLNDPVSRKKHRVNLVSADRDLRKKTSNIKPTVRAVVNPVTFWRRYLPRLKGVKGPNDNLPPENNF